MRRAILIAAATAAVTYILGRIQSYTDVRP
jgi:hypothetical protein